MYQCLGKRLDSFGFWRKDILSVTFTISVSLPKTLWYINFGKPYIKEMLTIMIVIIILIVIADTLSYWLLDCSLLFNPNSNQMIKHYSVLKCLSYNPLQYSPDHISLNAKQVACLLLLFARAPCLHRCCNNTSGRYANACMWLSYTDLDSCPQRLP